MTKTVTVEELKICTMDLILHARVQGGGLYLYRCREHPALTMSSKTGMGGSYMVGEEVIAAGEGRNQRIVDALNRYYAAGPPKEAT